MASPAVESYYFVNWVVHNNSNVHVANHRDWFTEYTPFRSYVGGNIAAPPDDASEVLGIGTVELDVRSHEANSKEVGPTHHRLVLHDVLHVPRHSCNVVGQPGVMRGDSRYAVIFADQGNSGLKDLKTGKMLGLFNVGPLWHLRLRGHALGHSSMNEGGMYVIGAMWSANERQRWELYKSNRQVSGQNGNGGSSMQSSTQITSGVAQLSTNESGGSSKSEKMGKKSNRDDAKKTSKAQSIHDTVSENYDEDEDTSDVDGDEFLAELEADPMSHMADYNFTSKELKWIKKHFGYSSNFMLIYGLKPYKLEDCDDAQTLIKTLMEDEGDEES